MYKKMMRTGLGIVLVVVMMAMVMMIKITGFSKI